MPSEDHTPLRNCPFCGGEARHETIHDGEFEELACSNCDYQICSSAIDGDLAEHWNIRAGEDALVEALEAFVMPGFDLDDVRKRTDPATLRKIARAREVVAAAKGEG